MTPFGMASPADAQRRISLALVATVLRIGLAWFSWKSGDVLAVRVLAGWALIDFAWHLSPFVSVRGMLAFLRRGWTVPAVEDASALLYLPAAMLCVLAGHGLIAVLMGANAWLVWTAQRKRRAYGRIVATA